MPSLTSNKRPSWGDLNFWTSAEYQDALELIRNTEDIRPSPELIFRPLITTPLDKVKVVIVGREPHVMGNHADGYALSSSGDAKVVDDYPVTLTNTLMELVDDQGITPPRSGSLKLWASQGVLMINDTWTVKANRPYSHYRMAWDKLTNEVLETVYLVNPKAVFVFFAPCRSSLYDVLPEEAEVIKMSGPAPTHAYSGFFRSRLFTRINTHLRTTGQKQINWRLL